ncbi:hypothetical protein BDV96DRAFT_160309 [Lophiotrema nucula]|uniref:Uncharacterized protein n=1 Tax=Lophiotrema nucula TaxID=690887 RepID=A0A6A5Z016_9PLEO|nr:hypothetical protein BDV96DRAFT_160309 [Lophiotrema nucula]
MLRSTLHPLRRLDRAGGQDRRARNVTMLIISAVKTDIVSFLTRDAELLLGISCGFSRRTKCTTTDVSGTPHVNSIAPAGSTHDDCFTMSVEMQNISQSASTTNSLHTRHRPSASASQSPPSLTFTSNAGAVQTPPVPDIPASVQSSSPTPAPVSSGTNAASSGAPSAVAQPNGQKANRKRWYDWGSTMTKVAVFLITIAAFGVTIYYSEYAKGAQDEGNFLARKGNEEAVESVKQGDISLALDLWGYCVDKHIEEMPECQNQDHRILDFLNNTQVSRRSLRTIDHSGRRLWRTSGNFVHHLFEAKNNRALSDIYPRIKCNGPGTYYSELILAIAVMWVLSTAYLERIYCEDIHGSSRLISSSVIAVYLSVVAVHLGAKIYAEGSIGFSLSRDAANQVCLVAWVFSTLFQVLPATKRLLNGKILYAWHVPGILMATWILTSLSIGVNAFVSGDATGVIEGLVPMALIHLTSRLPLSKRRIKDYHHSKSHDVYSIASLHHNSSWT